MTCIHSEKQICHEDPSCFVSDHDPEHSNSSWAEMRPYIVGSYCLEPLSLCMKQRLILQYLTPLGDYHELLSPILAHNAMDLIFFYINLKEKQSLHHFIGSIVLPETKKKCYFLKSKEKN